MENVLEDEYDDSFLSPNHQKIAELNDQFRKSFCGGKVLMTCGIDALDWATKTKIISKVQKFNEFNFKNDPHGEHDFGIVQEGDVEAYRKQLQRKLNQTRSYQKAHLIYCHYHRH